MTATSDADEVTALSDAYELALLHNDIEAMNEVFWHDPRVLRFGIADMQHGFDQIVAWRAQAAPVSADRTRLSRSVLALADGVVAVDITFTDGAGVPEAGGVDGAGGVDDVVRGVGRQSQTWVRLEEGWRIMRAHVSVIPQ